MKSMNGGRWYLAWALILGYVPAVFIALYFFDSVGAVAVMLVFGIVSMALKCKNCGARMFRNRDDTLWIPFPSRACRRCRADLRCGGN
jgi:hypothetical protein